MEETVLKFTTKEVTIELQGSEEFVERQIQFFRHYLEDEAPQAEPEQEDEGTRLSLENFFQESLLLFGYFLQEVEGQSEFSIEQIGGCFGVVGRPLPKNLHHAVGTLKRKHRWFQEGSKRGYYRLSDRGRKLVRSPL